MSKDIWHSAQEIPLFDDTVVFIDDLNDWHTGYTQRDNDGITDHDSGEIYTEENVLRWAYIKDLLALETELERTRKALDAAVDALDVISLKQHKTTQSVFLIKYAHKALEQINEITKGGKDE